ncbi:MAG TPA: FAD-binding oxidoreductase [Gemmatimonadaceae bacterium]|nr:FAD-binding oxidoreductase [Gemmatimonadaceae bacterium]
MKTLAKRLAKALRALGLVLGIVLLSTAVAIAWGVAETPVEHPPAPATVNDITQLNPIPVADILVPTTTDEIIQAVRSHRGPISIGGGRYSMGGQTASRGALQIDMRQFNRILAFDSVNKTITVQAGARWRQIQERIDPANLSIKVMQTYANFTVGGSLSVNVHGRYVGLGPVIRSVRSLHVVLADGTVVEASPSTHSDIFYGVIGGYGGIGVITDATLDLADDVRVRRQHLVMPVSAYKAYFFQHVRDSAGVVFHNADLYPPAFETVNAVSYVRTTSPVTIPDRLQPTNQHYRLDRFMFSVISEWPFGKQFRQHVLDPMLFRTHPVSWRNYEASYDVAELEPSSRTKTTYVLQEYFVPVEHFDDFVPKMRAVFAHRHVNVINVSIRHAKPDLGSLLAWAPGETFAFVVYYKQGTDAAARRAVGAWTRELTDSVLSVGGSYYLPYQPQATEAQFLRAYPRAPEFFALKRRLDPTYKFRNTLWDKYYSNAEIDPAVRAALDRRPGYDRDEGQTFLTHPEWYIVYSSDEYASWLQTRLPTDFPYLTSIGQFWVSYHEIWRATRRTYQFNWGYHVMIGVIGVSYSVELTLKAIYENTIGRFSDWTAGHARTDEDRYAATVAADYGRFIHIYPWYEYGFAAKLADLWHLPLSGPHTIRKLERRVFLTLEYGIKAVYAELITLATRSAYAPEEDHLQMVVTGWTDSLAHMTPAVTAAASLDSVHTLVTVPRYDAFRDLMAQLARQPSVPRITEIAGDTTILLTGVAPSGWTTRDPRANVLYALPLPTDRTHKRIVLSTPVAELLPFLRDMDAGAQLRVDHVYDY